MTAPISNGPTTTRLHHYAGHYWPKGAVPPTREEELEERVRKLEAQVAYLKKSIALKAQRRSQTGTKP